MKSQAAEARVLKGALLPNYCQCKKCILFFLSSLFYTCKVLMEVGIPVHFNFDGDAMLLELEAGVMFAFFPER